MNLDTDLYELKMPADAEESAGNKTAPAPHEKKSGIHFLAISIPVLALLAGSVCLLLLFGAYGSDGAALRENSISASAASEASGGSGTIPAKNGTAPSTQPATSAQSSSTMPPSAPAQSSSSATQSSSIPPSSSANSASSHLLPSPSPSKPLKTVESQTKPPAPAVYPVLTQSQNPLFSPMIPPQSQESEPTSVTASSDPAQMRTDGSYEGEYVNGARSGYGVMRYANGDVYEGQWSNGHKQGEGTLLRVNGEKYVGNWENDTISGYGTYWFSSGDTYSGEWENALRHGQGVFSWANGAVYDGDWVRDNRSGYGTYLFSNGDRYTGEWQDNCFHGYGEYTSPDGVTIYAGIWAGGELTEKYE